MEILIAGGGYIGMYTARRLERLLWRCEATVTVVDPRGYMTYQPFLAEAPGSGALQRSAAPARGDIVSRRDLFDRGHLCTRASAPQSCARSRRGWRP